MDLKKVTVLLNNLSLRFLSFFRRELYKAVVFLRLHYTWLSVLVFCILGFVLIPLLSWFFRYGYYDWWNWKGRAVRRIMILTVTLVFAKLILLGGIK